MRLLKLLNSMHFRTDTHLNLFKKSAIWKASRDMRGELGFANLAHHLPAFLAGIYHALQSTMGAQQISVNFDFNNAMYRRGRACAPTASPSTNYCERSEQIESLKFLKNVNAIGDCQNA